MKMVAIFGHWQLVIGYWRLKPRKKRNVQCRIINGQLSRMKGQQMARTHSNGEKTYGLSLMVLALCAARGRRGAGCVKHSDRGRPRPQVCGNVTGTVQDQVLGFLLLGACRIIYRGSRGRSPSRISLPFGGRASPRAGMGDRRRNEIGANSRRSAQFRVAHYTPRVPTRIAFDIAPLATV